MKRHQFNLRDLAWLVLVCSLVAGWLADHNRQERETNAAQREALAERRTRIARDMEISAIQSRFHVPRIDVAADAQFKENLRRPVE